MQGAQAGTEGTPEKRFNPIKNDLKEVSEVEVQDPFGDSEVLTAGNSTFVVGRDNWRDCTNATAVCSCCFQMSTVDGRDMLECSRCLGAVHLGCTFPPLTEAPEVLLPCVQSDASETSL